MKKSKLLISAATILFLGSGILAGCTEADNLKSDVSTTKSSKRAGKYPLIATDTESSMSDGEINSRVIIKYLGHNNKKQTIKLALDEDGNLADSSIVYSERILNDDQAQPYIVINDQSGLTKLTVYRQPYVSYSQNELSGTVVDKSTNK